MDPRQFSPLVTPEVWTKFPDYRALSIIITGFLPDHPIPRSPVRLPSWIDDHIAAWHEAFKSFGANPKRTAPSVDSLLRRYKKDDALPVISPIVDLYNAVSLTSGLSIGGEDIRQYEGGPRLVLADGTEGFDTMKDGLPVVEHPEPGEVVWRDDAGATCRRWNWRQCKRTAITAATVDFWFVFDRLPPMEMDELRQAGDNLVQAMQKACPTCTAESRLLQPDN